MGLKELEKLKRKLYRHKYCDFKKIFDLMDVDKKGYLDLRDIFDFMKSEDSRVSYADCERTLRRLDVNQDKRIDYNEFSLVLKPSKLFMDFRDPSLRSIASDSSNEHNKHVRDAYSRGSRSSHYNNSKYHLNVQIKN